MSTKREAGEMESARMHGICLGDGNTPQAIYLVIIHEQTKGLSSFGLAPEVIPFKNESQPHSALRLAATFVLISGEANHGMTSTNVAHREVGKYQPACICQLHVCGQGVW
ncbi:hypothetical protein PGTUg99_002698 [Puccinia graminis f. sp. tritici]|uniref:Uncharacterized protein n=1 Tax=Puccinia graminis f. sp. tritici TaxID=56615 RepID=A0A5B0NV07_PUCGR|nr:hypothetical protein PGTUg99_001633 [Puccinia graminis f. sp. tritici]KAA1136758.1 hypothetical protein PGTUg99_002698 [Puccinia graminis f. sp. tritici]